MSLIVNSSTARLLGLEKPLARILTSPDNSPVRRIINGRRTGYTGLFTSVKADFMQMPWESRTSERTAMVLAEASSRVVSYLAQPHRLEISIKEQKKPLVYFPDLQLKVHPSFLEDLDRGVPFSVAALSTSIDEPDDRLKTVVLEMKDDRDRRQFTPKYRAKLELARTIYGMMGIDFRIIHREEEIFPFPLRVAASVVSWRHTAVNQLDVWTAQRTLRSRAQPAKTVVKALGDGPLGWAKLRALHVRRIVEINLTDTTSADTNVRLLVNNSLHVPVRS